MEKETAKAIIAFMERIHLAGNEVPAYIRCLTELNEFLKDPPPQENNDADEPA